MSKYIAHFKGGPLDGQSQTLPMDNSVHTVVKTYDKSGFTTTSQYDLVKLEGYKLYYDLYEERLKGYYPEVFQK